MKSYFRNWNFQQSINILLLKIYFPALLFYLLFTKIRNTFSNRILNFFQNNQKIKNNVGQIFSNFLFTNKRHNQKEERRKCERTVNFIWWCYHHVIIWSNMARTVHTVGYSITVRWKRYVTSLSRCRITSDANKIDTVPVWQLE